MTEKPIQSTRKRTPGAGAYSRVPDELKRRLRPWIDVDLVGPEGLWNWLATALEVLPRPHAVSEVMKSGGSPNESPAERVRELSRDLIDCGADRARLTFLGQRYFSDNQVLARRIKALEAVVRTCRSAGRPVTDAVDDEATVAAERYLPVE